MKWLLYAFQSLLIGALVFGMGMVGYLAYGEGTTWYMPANVIAAVGVALFVFGENVVGDREWERAKH
jgi:hypothetical protein